MLDRLPAGHRNALLSYGTRLLARQLGQAVPADGPLASLLAPLDPAAEAALAAARAHLGDTLPLDAPVAPARLRSIFSLLALDDERRHKPAPATVPRRALDLDLLDGQDTTPEELWRQFVADVARLSPGQGQLDTFTALMARYGWAVPGSLLVPGVSVYEQFRAVAALVATVGAEADELLLVEADISGIQEMLYTITSKGAAKNLRGRSLYLQLLADAAARAVLHALALPEACLIASAGGNARLLARAADAGALAALRAEINGRLLRLHGGELALALAWAPVPAANLAADTFAAAATEAARRLDEQKARAFAEQAAAALDVVGVGRRDFCRICHVELPDRRYLKPDDPLGDGLRCDQCDSFGEVRANQPADAARPRHGLARLAAEAARELDASEPTYLAVTVGPLPPMPAEASWYGRPAWDAALAALGVAYAFTPTPRPRPATTIYRLNHTDFLPARPDPACAYGFRFLALATPRITERGRELEALQAFARSLAAAHSADLSRPEEQDEQANPDTIRTLTLMARWDSTGVPRYGVLRMDVDDLGRLFHRRLESRSLLHSAALSGALTRFFEGWLNRICAQADAAGRERTPQVDDDAVWRPVDEAWHQRMSEVTDDAGWRAAARKELGLADDHPIPARSKAPYVIYAGGDDMFVVGPWDVLPRLAARVRRDLCSYVLRGFVDPAAPLAPAPVTLSAGMVVQQALYPLYQAADEAGAALRAAKGRRRRNPARGPAAWETLKDAVTLLGVTVTWDELAQAEALAHTLARLIDHGVVAEGRERPDYAPHGLIQLLAAVARSYAEAGGELAEERLAYGRWMPLLAYGLRQMADRAPAHNPALRREILALAGEALDLTRVAGAAEWHTLRFLALPVRWAELLIRTGG